MEKIKKFIDIVKNWKGNVCLFGAGNVGKNLGYRLIHTYAQLPIAFYVDSFMTKSTVNGIPVKAPDYLYGLKENIMCFVTAYGSAGIEIVEQLKLNNVENYFLIDEDINESSLAAYICENESKEIRERFSELTDDKKYLSRLFFNNFGYKMDWDCPQTLNEKLQWLKVYDWNDIYTQWADKYRVRDYIREKFGEEYLVPLFFVTSNPLDINYKNIPDEHCIIKSNCGCHDFTIIRSKKEVEWEALQEKYAKIMKRNYYYLGRERHYKDIKPYIIVEKLLEDKHGKIPNDYKLTFFNGEFQFTYCSIDREGKNYRKIYDYDWKELPFIWTTNAIDLSSVEGTSIPQPLSWKKMLEIGNEIAKNTKYVRVDFYDVDGKLYFGEITLCHGAGFDKFFPKDYDLIYGNKLNLGRDKL